MNGLVLVSLSLGWFGTSTGFAQGAPEPRPVSASTPLLTPPSGENQRLYGPTRSSLVEPEVARDVSARFRQVFAQDGAPRLIVYVNRALVEEAGLQLSGRTERYNETTTRGKDGEDRASTTSNVSGENTYTKTDAPQPTLADQQTVREIERLFGRVFRNAGAKLADQNVAATLLAEQPGVRLASGQAARAREALQQNADIVIEVLISSRELTVRGVAGDRTFQVPDIQATAIQLSDAAILGQASSSDILGGGLQVSQIVQQFGAPDITEATAFALMEDMLTDQP